ncbi:MAG: hypothetical protein IT276_15140 [Ignavibacteriaceae bacterium]|nr:hypothetical protein [Ignavibacterium sp.]MCC6256250.1 hypothetical protein [Ignavibacteriaceae bacterium]
MKSRLYLVLMIIISFSQNVVSMGGEFEVIFDSIVNNRKFRIEINTSEYTWSWIESKSEVIFLPNYSFTTQRGLTQIRFDSPDNQDSAPYVMPWGIMNINIVVTDNLDYGISASSITIDFRDQRWAEGYGSSIDTRIIIDPITYQMYVSANQSIDPTDLLLSGQTLNIWDFWNQGTPTVANFKVPITLFNKIENTEISFGYLKANTKDILSGEKDYFKYGTTQSVEHGTLEKYTNVRNYSFKWSNSNRITPETNQNMFTGTFNFSTVIDVADKSITRNFRTVYPLTIKNNIIESNLSSVGDILFKDPTTDNQFHSYSAAGNGFVKNEAFYDLDLGVNGQLHQKYSIKAISPFIYNGRTYYWYSGDYNPTTQTDLLITGATTKTANYKGTQLTNQTNAITGNGQKKIVRTSDGHLHQVYESLNKVWYEKSTDNGATWQIMNGGQPLSGSFYSKQPSMDYYNTASGKILVIVYQAYDNNGSSVTAKIFKDGVFINYYILATYSHSIGVINEVNTTPVVSVNPNGKLLFVWSLNDAPDVILNSPPKGLYYKYANLYLNANGMPLVSWFTSTPVIMSRTSAASINPTLDVYKNSGQPFQLCYENSNQISYRTLTDDANQPTHLYVSSAQTTSAISGNTYNNKPSIIAVNNGARVVWEANNYGYSKKIVFRDPGYSYFWSFNTTGGEFNCINPNINRPDNYSAYYLSWSEDNTAYMVNSSLSLSAIRSLNIFGQDVQLNKGSTSANMYATTLQSASVPYYFTQSANLGSFYGLNKLQNIFGGTEGRSGVVNKDSASFYFNFGKILVDDANIGFVSIDDTASLYNEEVLNQYLVSNPFSLNDNSNFTFSIQYGVTDTLAAKAVLLDNDYILYSLQLVDYETTEIIGEYDNVQYSKTNLTEHNNLDYIVNTSGIGNRTVILKLKVHSNCEPGFALVIENSGSGNVV